MQILHEFSNDEPQLGVGELSRRLGIHKSVVSRLAASLVECHMLERDPSRRQLRLGFGAFQLGMLAARHNPLRPGPSGGALPLADVLTPGGQPVGSVNPGATSEIRTVTTQDFAKIQTDLLIGASPIPAAPGYIGTWYQRRDGTIVGIRLSQESGITIDVIQSNVPSIPNGFKVHQP